MARNEDFFTREPRDGTRLKLAVLSWFLEPWCAKTGVWADKVRVPHIWYVDAFGGEGRLGDDSLGSPLIAAKRSLIALQAGRLNRPAIYAVEKRPRKFAKLTKACAPFITDGVQIELRQGDFWDHVPDIIQRTRGCPILLFVDPFGVSPIDMAQLRTLIERDAPIDVIIRLHDPAIHRLATEYPERITRALGTDEWRSVWDATDDSEKRIRGAYRLFKQSLISGGNFEDVLFHRVKLDIDRVPNFTLAFASRHLDGLELWSDAIATNELALLSEQDGWGVGSQPRLIDRGILDARREGVRDSLRRFLFSHPGSTGREARRWMIKHHRPLLLGREVTAAVRYLHENGEIEALHGRGVLNVPLLPSGAIVMPLQSPAEIWP